MNHTISARILSIGRSGLFGMVFSALHMTPSLWAFSPSLQLRKTFARFFRGLPSLRRIFSRPPYDHYKNNEEEEKYWEEAARTQRVLQQSDARHAGAEVRNRQALTSYVPPLVMYYTPALLPEYRDAPRKKKEAKRYHISGKNYCKWHWMVFPGDVSGHEFPGSPRNAMSSPHRSRTILLWQRRTSLGTCTAHLNCA
jgi:hypothetical protein